MIQKPVQGSKFKVQGSRFKVEFTDRFIRLPIP
jgi:hypothetical protein